MSAIFLCNRLSLDVSNHFSKDSRESLWSVGIWPGICKLSYEKGLKVEQTTLQGSGIRTSLTKLNRLFSVCQKMPFNVLVKDWDWTRGFKANKLKTARGFRN